MTDMRVTSIFHTYQRRINEKS